MYAPIVPRTVQAHSGLKLTQIISDRGFTLSRLSCQKCLMYAGGGAVQLLSMRHNGPVAHVNLPTTPVASPPCRQVQTVCGSECFRSLVSGHKLTRIIITSCAIQVRTARWEAAMPKCALHGYRRKSGQLKAVQMPVLTPWFGHDGTCSGRCPTFADWCRPSADLPLCRTSCKQ